MRHLRLAALLLATPPMAAAVAQAALPPGMTDPAPGAVAVQAPPRAPASPGATIAPAGPGTTGAAAAPGPTFLAPAAPAPRPAGPRLPQTLSHPLVIGPPVLAPPPAPAVRADSIPLPNRALEPPRERVADVLAPSLEPMILPPERRPGMTFGREHLRETGPDRPFDNILPGARLRIPFEQAPPR